MFSRIDTKPIYYSIGFTFYNIMIVTTRFAFDNEISLITKTANSISLSKVLGIEMTREKVEILTLIQHTRIANRNTRPVARGGPMVPGHPLLDTPLLIFNPES